MNQPTDSGRSALWVRAIASLPWSVLYALAAVLAFLARYVVRFKVSIARDNLQRCFPELPHGAINRLLSAYYRQLGQVVVEFLKIASMSPEQMRSHITPINFERVRAQTDAGRSVI